MFPSRRLPASAYTLACGAPPVSEGQTCPQKFKWRSERLQPTHECSHVPHLFGSYEGRSRRARGRSRHGERLRTYDHTCLGIPRFLLHFVFENKNSVREHRYIRLAVCSVAIHLRPQENRSLPATKQVRYRNGFIWCVLAPPPRFPRFSEHQMKAT